MRAGRGLILSAPSSGSGKTLVTLGLLAALRRKGLPVRGAKSGPDYIDPRFHEAATGRPALNLDAWAMSAHEVRSRAAGPGFLVIEGAMGLFDGAPPEGRGSSADLARILQLPVVLIVDVARQAQSVAALVSGFANHDPNVEIPGVILNRVGSPRHETMIRKALAASGPRVLGCLPRVSDLSLPGRHLGLVQAEEHPDIAGFLDAAADWVEDGLDLDRILEIMRPVPEAASYRSTPPLAQRIAVAKDEAFGFSYPHVLSDWRSKGAEVSFFSPLADEAPPDSAGAVFLPGGYPELHAGALSCAEAFKAGLRAAAERGATIYGECGGYMTLGEGLIDADGTRHAMAGLLKLETSFAERKLHLGYRTLTGGSGPLSGTWAGHEFHYATTLRAEGPPLFLARDAEGNDLGPAGLRTGPVQGSFAHLIAPCDTPAKVAVSAP